MTTEELSLEQLQRENLDLQERVRVSDELLAQALARIEDLIARELPANEDKKYWFGYHGKQGTERGAFDMRIVTSWKATLVSRKGWHATAYVGEVPHTMEPEFSEEFWVKYDKYIKGQL